MKLPANIKETKRLKKERRKRVSDSTEATLVVVAMSVYYIGTGPRTSALVIQCKTANQLIVDEYQVKRWTLRIMRKRLTQGEAYFFSRHVLLNRRRLDARSAARDPRPSLTHDAPEECVDGAGLAIDASRGVVAKRVEVDASSGHYFSFFLPFSCPCIGRRLCERVGWCKLQKNVDSFLSCLGATG